MIASKSTETRRSKLRTARLMERLYKERKCRDCSVVVTKMDFAKILGKFTKVKIQYESSSPKSKKSVEVSTPKSNSRLKNNENGIVKIHRNANKQPAKNLHNQKKDKFNDISTPLRNNILKENNVLKRATTPKETKSFSKQLSNIRKQYAIIFNEPTNNNNNDIRNDFCLADLLPHFNKNILPSVEWDIDYFPKAEEPKVDKVYDRIAAELEDLMCSDKPLQKHQKPETKVDEFPSIMDILNDNTTVSNVDLKEHNNSLEFKSNLDSSDVEAMLLGKSSSDQVKESEPMELDNSYVNKLIDDVQSGEDEKSKNEEEKVSKPSETNDFENPSSPSILDEALQQGIEEHLPNHSQNQLQNEAEPEATIVSKMEHNVSNNAQSDTPTLTETKQNGIVNIPEESSFTNSDIFPITHIDNIKYVTFKKNIDGKCLKSVTCPKNLKYSIELDNKSVEFIGAPKYISSIDDLQVLLQIVNESDLQSLYVYIK